MKKEQDEIVIIDCFSNTENLSSVVIGTSFDKEGIIINWNDREASRVYNFLTPKSQLEIQNSMDTKRIKFILSTKRIPEFENK